MSVVNLDLNKNPDVAALIADMQPGEKVYACFTIKDKDDQTGTFRLQEMAATRDELPSGDEGYEDDDEEGEEAEESPEGKEEDGPSTPEETPTKKLAKRLASPDPMVNY